MEQLLALLSILGLMLILAKWANKTDIAKIKGLPELPGIPIFGSLFLLGKHHARNCAKLRETYGDVFQVRLGRRRIIYANSFEAVKELWIHNQSALISRPTFWTFHSVVSETQGVFTLGTSPWSEPLKRARKAAATALNRQATQQYLPFIDLEATNSINELFQNVKGNNEIDPNGYFQRFSINISLTLAYGIRLEGSIQNDTLKEVVEVERELANIRGVAHCWQDYVPLLRLWPGNKKKAIECRARRDKYILSFYNKLKQRIADGTDHPCIAGNVLKDPDAQLQDNELKTICLTMVAAGLDTLPGNINMTIAYLSSPHGQQVQERAYEEIVKSYPEGDPWHMCLAEEKCEYMQSFVKVSIRRPGPDNTVTDEHQEVLRYWSTLNMSFTRQSTKPIVYQGATIPAGTPFFMNMWSANHDDQHFASPMEFIPDRFVGVPEAGGGTQHFGYGAGTRMCAGAHLANRELYVIFTRIILAFHIRPSDDPRNHPVLDTIDCNQVPTSMVTQPKPFKVKFVPRNADELKGWVERSFENTAYLS